MATDRQLPSNAKLYARSVRAMKRYFKDEKPAKTKDGRALQKVMHEMYRAGWMYGVRSGWRKP